MPADPPAAGNTLARLPVLRVFARFGMTPTLQAIALLYLAGCVIVGILGRLDLLDPTAIGSDASNYLAAGERLNAGHPLYALSPGDRDVPLNPPFWTVPLLSPPPIAVAWRFLAILPGNVAMIGWAVACGLVIAVAAFWLVARLTPRAALASFFVGPMVGLTVWSGNLHAFLTAALIYGWLEHERGRSWATGVIAGAATALKLSPILVLPWFLARRDWRGAGAMMATGAVIALLSLLGAGWDNHVAYLDVMKATSAAGATRGSIPDFLVGFGVPATIANLGPMVALGGGALAMWPLRRHPRAGWAVAIAAGLYSTPVVHFIPMSVLLAALAPYRTTSLPAAIRARRKGRSEPADGGG